MQGSVAPAPCNMTYLLYTNITIPTLGGAADTPTYTNATVTVYIYGSPLAGNYCPSGSSTPLALCPAGFYCPDAATLLNCTEGSYCLEGAIEPTSCPGLSKCSQPDDPGTNTGYGLAVLIVLLLVAFFYVVGCYALKAKNLKFYRECAANDDLRAIFAPIAGAGVGRVVEPKVLSDVQPRLTVECKELGLLLGETSVLKVRIYYTYDS